MERTYRITPQRDGRWQCKAEDVDLPLVFCDSPEEAEELFSAMSAGLGRTRLRIFDKAGLLLRIARSPRPKGWSEGSWSLNGVSAKEGVARTTLANTVSNSFDRKALGLCAVNFGSVRDSTLKLGSPRPNTSLS